MKPWKKQPPMSLRLLKHKPMFSNSGWLISRFGEWVLVYGWIIICWTSLCLLIFGIQKLWWRTWCRFRGWKVSKTLFFTCRSPYSTLSFTKQNRSSINTNGTRLSHSHNQASSCSPQQDIRKPHPFTVYSSKLSWGEKHRHGVGIYKLSARK